jgi:hypothetical protein
MWTISDSSVEMVLLIQARTVHSIRAQDGVVGKKSSERMWSVSAYFPTVRMKRWHQRL